MGLAEINSNLKKMDTVDIMVDVLDELSEFIADLNRSQLASGKREDGSDIEPEYTSLTEILKRPKSGLAGVTSHVTLFDTGQFHKSIFASVFSDEILLDSKDSKLGKLESKYKNILGLTKESTEKLKQKALPLFWNKFYEQLLK